MLNDLEEWDRIIAIDLRGIFMSMKYEIPLMLKQGGGAIVNTSSGAELMRAQVISEEPIGRMGRPEEIASAVLWLCSDASGVVIGSALVVDGGQTIQ